MQYILIDLGFPQYRARGWSIQPCLIGREIDFTEKSVQNNLETSLVL